VERRPADGIESGDAEGAPPLDRRPESLLVPGLGQLYAGEPKRGIALLLGHFGIVALLPAVGLLRTFAGLAVFLTGFLLAQVWIVWDAARAARRNRSYVLRPFNRWYVYLAAFLVVNLLITPRITTFWATRSFSIPSGAMEPALLIGDHLIADMKWYGSRRPERGDLVALRGRALYVYWAADKSRIGTSLLTGDRR